MKNRSDSTHDLGVQYGNQKEEHVYSPINDQPNIASKRLSELRDRYNGQNLTYSNVDTHANKVERTYQQDFANYKPRLKSIESQSSVTPSAPRHNNIRSNSLPYQETTSKNNIGKLPERSFTDNLEYHPKSSHLH